MEEKKEEFYYEENIHISIDNQIYRTLNFISALQKEAIPLHSHGSGCYEIHYVAKGYGKAEISGQVYELKEGTLYVTGPHIAHMQMHDEENPIWEYCIYLQVQGSKGGPISGIFEKTHFWIGYHQNKAEHILKELFYELEHKNLGYKIQVETYINQLLIFLVRQYIPKEINKNERILPGISFRTSLIVEESFLYGYPTLTLESLSKRLGLSQRQTERLLQNLYGKNFRQKKREARMAAASMLLTDTKKSITEISQLIGYSSMEHFSSAFRLWYKMSPTQYRKRNGRGGNVTEKVT